MTTETQTPAAATTTEGAAPSETTAQQSATGADTSGQQQPSTEGTGTEGQQAAGAKTEGEQEKSQGAPEKYEFKAPEGTELNASVIGAYSDVAKELDLSQEAAQKVLDKVAPVMAAQQADALRVMNADWLDATKSDKEFGGEQLDGNLAMAKKALEVFGTPELTKLLNDTGLGNHPEVIRVFYRTGKAISEDRFTASGSGGKPADDVRRLYSNSSMNP